MEENQIYTRAANFIENSSAIQQIFRTLPQGSAANVTVADRIEMHVFLNDGSIATASGHKATADVLYSVDPEVFRRLGDRNPSDVSDFFAEFGREMLAGRIHMKLLKPPTHFLKSDYLAAIKKLIPTLQGEALQKVMMGAMHASSFVSSLKNKFIRKP